MDRVAEGPVSCAADVWTHFLLQFNNPPCRRYCLFVMISSLLSCRAGIYSDCVSPALSTHYDTLPSWPSIRGSVSVCE